MAEDTLQAAARLTYVFIASFKKGRPINWPGVRPPKSWLDRYKEYDRHLTEVDKATRAVLDLERQQDDLRRGLKKELGCTDSASQIDRDIYEAILRQWPGPSTKENLEELCAASSTEPR